MKKHFYFYLQCFISIVFLITVFISICFNVIHFEIDEESSYFWYGISDWLINYQGGLVRRGLIGEILYQIYHIKPYPVKYAILIIDLVFVVTFIVLSLHAFYKRHWSILPLLFPYVCTGAGLLSYRRDFLMMVLIYVIYDIFFKYLKNHKVKYLIWTAAVMCLCCFIYEPFFFLTVPIMSLLLLTDQSDIASWHRRAFRVVGFTIFPIVSMTILFLFKGGSNVVSEIWNSWEPLFEAYPQTFPMPGVGCGVEALKNTFPQAVRFNTNLLFRLDELPSMMAVVSNILLIISFPMIWFIVMRVPSVNYRTHVLESTKETPLLSSVFIVQCVAMLPMFGILSCDVGRTLPYCIYTTFFFVYLSGKHDVNISLTKYIDSFSLMVNASIDRNKLMSSFLFYLFVLFLAPLREWQSPKLQDTLLYRYLYLASKFIKI